MTDEMVTLATNSNNKVTTIGEECIRMVREASQTLVTRLQDTLRAGQAIIANSHNELAKGVKDINSEILKLKDGVQTQLALGEEQKQVLKTFGTTLKEVTKQYSALTRTAESLSGAQAQLVDVRDAFKDVSQACNTLSRQFETVKLTMEGQISTATKLASMLQHELETIRQRREELEKEVSKTDKVLQEVYRGLAANTEYIIQRLGG